MKAFFVLIAMISFVSCKKTMSNVEEVKVPQVTNSSPLPANLVELKNKYKVKVLFSEFLLSSPPNVDQMVWQDYDSMYRDSNGNGLIDREDRGFFEPASSMKLGLVALLMEKNPKPAQIEDARRVLVVSDNEAANRVLDGVGMAGANKRFKELGIRSVVSRRFGASGPSIDVEGCHEANGKNGNCMTSEALALILLRVVHPEWFGKRAFDIPQAQHNSMLKWMSALPRNEGYPEDDDNYCRPMEDGYQKHIKPIDGKAVMYTKCGVATGNRYWIDASLVQRSDGRAVLSVMTLEGVGKDDPELYSVYTRFAPFVWKSLLK